jgi:predicted ATPase
MRIACDHQLMSLMGHGKVPSGIKAAMARPRGSRFYKCAFQVNPFEYGGRHSKSHGVSDEPTYNALMVEACLEAGIEIVAITDHFRADTSQALADRLREAGVIVFPGFEANSSEGVHILCLFPPSTCQTELSEHIGACDVQNRDDPSPISNKRFVELLKLVEERGGLSIAAHVTSDSGLLRLSGQPRITAWCSKHLLAAAIPGPVSDVPPEYAQIVRNSDPAHRRDRPLAFINASDVCQPSDFPKPGVSTFVKMSDVTIEGLRQGFIDHESRIRLNSDDPPKEHAKIIAVAWQGGLLDEQSLALNEGLNVLIGGRGAGKSTVIESLRYVFDLKPKGKEAGRVHDAMTKGLLGAKSAVSVLIHLPEPSPAYYLAERAYGQRPQVRDQSGAIVDGLSPSALLPSLEVYGQHEISELTRDKAKLAEILKRFVGESEVRNAALDGIKSQLSESRRTIIAKLDGLEELEQALAALPSLKEQQKRFEQTDLAEKVREKTSLQTEARLIENVSARIASLRAHTAEINPGDGAVAPVLPPETEEPMLPNRAVLQSLEPIAQGVDTALKSAAETLSAAAKRLEGKLEAVRAEWKPFSDAADERYIKLAKTLRDEGYDPERYVSISDQIAKLEPKDTERRGIATELAELQTERRELISALETADRDTFQELSRAAQRVSRRLSGRVRARVRPSNDISPLKEILSRHVQGNLSGAYTRLEEQESLSLSELARVIRQGADALRDAYAFTSASAEKIAAGGERMILEIEECLIPAEAVIELNVGRDGAEVWKDLDRLSAGQRATAVLMLLLLPADAPLAVDQPEDDLDNDFIVRHIVKTMRKVKKDRQFIFSSHNPNIPVLGDAEQIIGLTAEAGDAGDRAKVYPQHCGAIDTPSVKELIKSQLEGGEQAFQIRRQKYGI